MIQGGHPRYPVFHFLDHLISAVYTVAGAFPDIQGRQFVDLQT
jgi:hypothetical protein